MDLPRICHGKSIILPWQIEERTEPEVWVHLKINGICCNSGGTISRNAGERLDVSKLYKPSIYADFSRQKVASVHHFQ